MNEGKFTPGPWRTGVLPGLWKRSHDVGISTEFVTCISTDCTGAEFEDGRCATCVAVAIGTDTSGSLTEANAQLIAASPDLLAACEAAHCYAVRRASEGHALPPALVESLFAATAKARGERKPDLDEAGGRG